jgi:hypothetical protein
VGDGLRTSCGKRLCSRRNRMNSAADASELRLGPRRYGARGFTASSALQASNPASMSCMLRPAARIQSVQPASERRVGKGVDELSGRAAQSTASGSLDAFQWPTAHYSGRRLRRH